MDGQILVQQDREPIGGYHSTRLWQPGEFVIDRFAFSLPESVSPQEVLLRIGWYSWPELERLTARSETHEIVDNSLIIKMVNGGPD